MQGAKIVLKKVSVHNLKGVDLTLEPGQLVVFTGVSGSGKSSLAFDTIYAEGQRRYIESLSHQARRSLGEIPKPEAESISGVAPTIAIEQKLAGRTPRSTVGTMSGIYDFLRVLYARVGVPHCPVSGEPVAAQSKEKILAEVEQGAKEGARLIFLAPYAKDKKGEFKEDFAELLSKGFTRLRVDGSWVDLGEVDSLDGSSAHTVEIVVDRIVVSQETRSRLLEAVSSALELGQGFFSIVDEESTERAFSQHAYSKKSGLSYGPLQPHDFSFNHPAGMCPTCHGLGVAKEFDLSRVINPVLSISEDCCVIASSYATVRYGNIYNNLARLYKFKVDTPWENLSDAAKHVFLYGTEQKWTRMRFVHPTKNTRWSEYVQWRGVIHEAMERLTAAKSDLYRNKMATLMTETLCPSCKGARIKPYPAVCTLEGKQMAEITAMPLIDAHHFFQNLRLSPIEELIGEELLKEVRERLQFLIDVGLSYLGLDRMAPSLSGGESQRVRLASQIGAGLVGAIYILDEPSIGLHATDHHKLIETLFRLRDQGNTVLVVEHDRDTMEAADCVVDVGPGAGSRGGEILCCGSVEDLMHTPRSITGAYLSGKKKIAIPKKRRKPTKEIVTVVGAEHHNLKKIDVSIPLGIFVCVTGVSGSGKSSLVFDILYPALANHFHGATLSVGKHKKIEGLEYLDKVIAVDQSPIGRTPRSNAATYIKLFDEIRDLFAQLPEAKMRGLEPGHFSFNVKEGSCSYCSGLGQVRIDMDFMEDAWVECPQCKGKRFDPEILAIQFKGHNIADVLTMDVEHALVLFEALPSMRRKLELLSQVGLDYLQLGQPSTTLSGGEAQRIKLAKELVRPASGRTLYILDEPTTGLHFEDIDRLIQVLQKLVDKGNSVLVIEHNLEMIRCADYLIDIGPKAGAFGGELMGSGTPEQIAKKKTATGKALSSPPSFVKSKGKKSSPVTEIRVLNAEQNNLKSVSVSIPRGKITVFTGPSGSGKSSLAFETLYAEGQRRYTETLSAYSRSLIKQLPKPKVDKIDGLLPSIALEQKTGGLNPRSTVGTITEIYDLLRVLFAHQGTAYCPETGDEIRHISKEIVVSKVLNLPKGEKIQILTPLALDKKESFPEFLARLSSQGYLRIRLNQTSYELDEPIPFKKHQKNELYLVIDRLLVDTQNEKRLFEAIEKATALSQGIVVVAREESDLYFNLAFAVEKTGKSYPPLTPQTFSFNHDSGMCLECQGLGTLYGAHLTEEKRIYKYSILEVCNRLFKDKGSREADRWIEGYFSDIDVEVPLKQLSSEELHLFFNGGPERKLKKGPTLRWIGLQPLFAQIVRMGTTEYRDSLLPLMRASICTSCNGGRLNPLASNVRIQNISLPEFCHLPLEEAYQFMKKLLVATPFLAETHAQIIKHFEFLLSIGLTYLSLDRSAPTLSGGELQRIRLARQLGSALTSCLYLLDEPTIGLHPHNSELLNVALRRLCDLGNTLVLVEHDPLIIEKADYLFDFGPRAGKEGGEITAHGTIDQILKDPHSLTGAYLSGRKTIPIPKTRRPFQPDIQIEGASLHNLKNLSLGFPKSAITCLTGVSGSGKSTLMRHLLKPAAELAIQSRKDAVTYLNTQFSGLGDFEKVITIDQSPIGQTSRADVSTYSEVQPLIRAHFAALPLAQAKGLQPRHFSPNHIRGMCKSCWGLGYKTVDLQFLPAVYTPCDACHGNRLNPISLEVRYKGKHFGEVLQMSVAEALHWFSAIPRIARRLSTLEAVGLCYLKLGQELSSLSGGEAQRLRLSRELAKRESSHTLYLIDEPTVGLHSEDIAKLLPIFHRLADKKNTLIIIEHNLDVIVNADYIIDLGPDAGPLGGQIMAQGTPEKLARSPRSRTAPFIASRLNTNS